MIFSRSCRLAFICGLVIAVCVSIFFGFLALNHDPQEEYSSNVFGLLLIVLPWFIVVFLPFTVAGAVLEVVIRMRYRRGPSDEPGSSNSE